MAQPTVKADVENRRSEQQGAVTDEERFGRTAWSTRMIEHGKMNPADRGRDDDRQRHDRRRG